MRTITKLLLAVFVIIIFIINAACEKQNKGWKGTLETVDGVTTVINPTEPLYDEMMLTFEEELSIGEIEGDENYMFGNRVYLNTDELGNFYVNDWDRKRIQKYDFQGNYLLTIGRKGKGPGEFQNVWQPRFDRDKNMYVSDISLRRISLFDTEGNLLRQIKMPSVFENTYINSKGFYISLKSEVLEESIGARIIYVFGLFDDQFNPMAEIHRKTEVIKPRSGKGSNGMAQMLADSLSSMAFKPSWNYALAENDLFYFGYPEEYTISVYSSEGKLLRIIEREYIPIKITERDKEGYIKAQELEFFRFLPPTADALKEKAIQKIKYPKSKPAYQHFMFMENGWLVVIVDSLENKNPLIDIFDAEGKYIAHFKSDIPVEGLFFKNGKAYAVATENGYKFIKRYNFEIQEYNVMK